MGRIVASERLSKTGEPFRLRSADPDDAERFLAYVREVARNTPFFIMEPDEFNVAEDEERKWIEDHTLGPGKLLIVAESGGRIIGNLSFENGLRRRIAHRGTFGLSVADAWRGKGVGTALLQTLIEWATENPLIEKIKLEVFATNTVALGLYRKFGFVEDGRCPSDVKYGPGSYVDTISMYRFV
jgi:RimJ/RimL family protein N-acetyltransferase